MPNDHYTDTACAPHITEHGTCATCGAAWDPEPCPGCGGHAYHEDGCPTMVRPAPTRGARSDLLWGARWALHEARWAAERGRPLDLITALLHADACRLVARTPRRPRARLHMLGGAS